MKKNLFDRVSVVGLVDFRPLRERRLSTVPVPPDSADNRELTVTGLRRRTLPKKQRRKVKAESVALL